MIAKIDKCYFIAINGIVPITELIFSSIWPKSLISFSAETDIVLNLFLNLEQKWA